MSPKKYLLIKAWGYGFWSDISHVLGQLLVSEISGRTPIVYWGANSLFSDSSCSNVFDFYFNSVSDVKICDLQVADYDFWPPKWNAKNLMTSEINKMNGPYSRIDGYQLLDRPERVVISDFHTRIIDLLPWIQPNHPLHDMSVDNLYRHLLRKYLHPKRDIADGINQFYQKYLASMEFMSAHVRGSDKIFELKELNIINKQYEEKINKYLSTHCHGHIFLMTDDARILNYFRGLYGDKIITTACQRTGCNTGIHYLRGPDKRKLGVEVMTDTYLAARSGFFVGNGFSNPSLMVKYLGDWSNKEVCLFGENLHH